MVRSALVLLACSALLMAGCSSHDNATGPDAHVEDHALLLGLRVDTIDGRFIYMGAFPDVPTSNPSRDKMIELAGSWQVTGYGGSAYAWEQETARLTRWTVDANLNMQKGKTMSLFNLGLAGWRYHAFVSPTRAYTLGFESGIVAVWNSSTSSTSTCPTTSLTCRRIR